MTSIVVRRSWLVAALCLTLTLSWYLSTLPSWRLPRPTHTEFLSPFASNASDDTPWFGASNATLGFGAIYVLTEHPESWRVQGLLKAANLTGLQVQLAVQEHLSDEAVLDRLEVEPKNGTNSARAFMNHLAVLDMFAHSEYETALIVEDDVDFSVHIRDQMEILSHAFWQHAGEPWETASDEAALHPYREWEWDLLWAGHTGIQFVLGTDVFEYEDPYALPWNRVETVHNNYFEQMALQITPDFSPPQQLIFLVAPIATFAYATTRSHAARMVQKMLVDGVFLKDDWGFDGAINVDCVGLGHRCVAPVPELFHHHLVDGESRIAAEGDGAVQDLEWYHTKHKFTYNIEWSARCNALQVGEKVGDKWQCLPNRDDTGFI